MENSNTIRDIHRYWQHPDKRNQQSLKFYPIIVWIHTISLAPQRNYFPNILHLLFDGTKKIQPMSSDPFLIIHNHQLRRTNWRSCNKNFIMLFWNKNNHGSCGFRKSLKNSYFTFLCQSIRLNNEEYDCLHYYH